MFICFIFKNNFSFKILFITLVLFAGGGSWYSFRISELPWLSKSQLVELCWISSDSPLSVTFSGLCRVDQSLFQITFSSRSGRSNFLKQFCFPINQKNWCLSKTYLSPISQYGSSIWMTDWNSESAAMDFTGIIKNYNWLHHLVLLI